MNVEVLPHDICKLQPPKLYENVQELYFQAGKLFFLQKAKKWQNVIFGPMYCSTIHVSYETKMEIILKPNVLSSQVWQGGHLEKAFGKLQIADFKLHIFYPQFPLHEAIRICFKLLPPP